MNMLLDFVSSNLLRHSHYNVLDWARKSYRMNRSPVTTVDASKRCVFSGSSDGALEYVVFHCADERCERIIESPPFVVSAAYIVVLRAWYLLTHVSEYVRAVVSADACSTPHKTQQQRLQRSALTLSAINHAARFVFNFFYSFELQRQQQEDEQRKMLAAAAAAAKHSKSDVVMTVSTSSTTSRHLCFCNKARYAA
jgi:hypothetical protein